MIGRRLALAGVLAAACLSALRASVPLAAAPAELPARLTDQEFWRLSEELSEPNGFFRSDNLLSNELGYPFVLNDLVSRAKPTGVYLGVGPEQNFHYLAAIRPRMAFIIDIRRGNLHLQLMYKALFELSADRADFVSRLFTKKRPAGLTTQSTTGDLMNAYWDVTTSDVATYKANLQAIDDLLMKKHGFPLSADDVAGIEYVYYNFYWFGPSINYSSSTSGGGVGGGNSRTTYADLMMSVDGTARGRGYLATEENFAFLKDLESKNLIVPVVGNFAGPKAIRAVGAYVREHGALVSAFYLSNVEQYLNQDGIWGYFCANVASLPLDDSSTFIRSRGGMQLGPMTAEVRGCAPASPTSGSRLAR